jgi:hypothetical protein
MGWLKDIFTLHKQRDCKTIAYSLAILGTNTTGKSMFLDRLPENAQAIIKQFIENNSIEYSKFAFGEHILRYSNAVTVISNTMILQDKVLQNDIISRLKTPDIFIEYYDLASRITNPDKLNIMRSSIEHGYNTFIDEHRNTLFTASEELADKFMRFLTNDSCGKYDDTRAWLVFTTAIHVDITTLIKAVDVVLKQLDLR